MDTELLGLLASVILGQGVPALVAWVNRILPEGRKWHYFASLVVSVVIGGLTVVAENKFDVANILATLGLVFTSSQTAYHSWFKDSKLDKKISFNGNTDE